MKRTLIFALPVLQALSSLGAAPAAFPSLDSVYVHYTAENPANLTIPPLQQTFSSSEVNLSKHTLTLPDLGFSAIVYPAGIGPGTPVYFSSAGTLPEPLQKDTPYYVIPAPGGGYKVFAMAADADAPLQPGGVLGEKVLPAQNVSQGVCSVKLTSGGSGTHTLKTKLLLSQLTDLTTNGYHSCAVNLKDKHTLLEVDTDASGKKFIRTGGATARENFVGSYSAYGQTFLQADRKSGARKHVGGRRVVYQIFVGRIRSFLERQVLKVLADPTLVSPDLEQIKYGAENRMAGKLVTGDLINAKTYADSVLPAPLIEGKDYYARKVDNKFITLHPSSVDATNNTNVIDLTTAGAGSFLVYAPERVGDARRWSFFAEVLEPGKGGGNTLSARLSEPVPRSASIVKIKEAFSVEGSSNGEITGFGSLPDLISVVLWTPPRAALPYPLKAGVTYWTSKVPGSNRAGRLHASLESARESIGKRTADSSCIKFTSPGSGEMLTSYGDGASAITFGTLGNIEPFETRIPLGPLCVLVFKIDFDDPSQSSAVATLGLNEPVTERKAIKLEKGLTPTAVEDGARAWTLFNSAQGHVPIDMDLYEMVFGSSAGPVQDDEIQGLVDYLKAKYNIL